MSNLTTEPISLSKLSGFSLQSHLDLIKLLQYEKKRNIFRLGVMMFLIKYN